MKLIDKELFSALCEVDLCLMSLGFINRMEECNNFDILCPLMLTLYIVAAMTILMIHTANEGMKD
jgi:hypothetical protein